MVTRKPPWIRAKLPVSARYQEIKARARTLKLATVCEEAQCPNIGECWSEGTATFMVMGDTCTRGCRFCAVDTSRKPPALDADEPKNVALAIAEMGLDYVVVTSVNRDDLPDGGSGHFAACIREIRAASPTTMVEVLIPDFQGHVGQILAVVQAEPEVIAHNIETVQRLTPKVRDPRAAYGQSLDVLAAIKALDAQRYTKSSIQVGHGETDAEIRQTMKDLRSVGVDFLTLGQYLQPAPKYLPVEHFVTPDTFDRWRDEGLALGFRYVASGPMVRSSYKAGEFFIREFIERQRPSELPARYAAAHEAT